MIVIHIVLKISNYIGSINLKIEINYMFLIYFMDQYLVLLPLFLITFRSRWDMLWYRFWRKLLGIVSQIIWNRSQNSILSLAISGYWSSLCLIYAQICSIRLRSEGLVSHRRIVILFFLKNSIILYTVYTRVLFYWKINIVSSIL